MLWIGRMTAEKGPHRAIAAARAAGVPLVLAGVIQPGQQAFFDREVAPHIDGDRVRFLGEIGGSLKRSVFAGARALLMPISWQEPFGMVMVEALACGTPVIAFPAGAASELVVDGRTGFLVEDETAMAAAVGRLASISARDCRAWVAEHCDVDVVAGAYESAYRAAARPRDGDDGACLSALSASSTAAPSWSATVSATCATTKAAITGSSARTLASSLAGFCGSARSRSSCSDWTSRQHFAAQFFLTPRVGPETEAPCSVMRRRLIDHVWMEEISVINHRHESSHDRRDARARHGLRRPVRGQGRSGRSQEVTSAAR